ncbi:replication protein RepA4 [Klebsiella variicola]|nr:replication protein RepA4 [Klebsiella variicola]TXV22327.1 replication protein RepA4 [Klebsiella pneumoniae]
MSQMPLYAVGVVPARRQPQSGRTSALAGRRAAYEREPNNSQ